MRYGFHHLTYESHQVFNIYGGYFCLKGVEQRVYFSAEMDFICMHFASHKWLQPPQHHWWMLNITSQQHQHHFDNAASSSPSPFTHHTLRTHRTATPHSLRITTTSNKRLMERAQTTELSFGPQISFFVFVLCFYQLINCILLILGCTLLVRLATTKNM